MQIERSRLNRWLNNPVTKAYMESQKQLQTEVAQALLESNETDPSKVTMLYHRAQGAMAFLDAYKDPVDVMLVLHEIKEDVEGEVAA